MGEERIRAASQREELAWAAGFWDGEGSCGCYERNDGQQRRASNSHLQASVNQKDREVLDRFCEAVGLGKVYGPYAITATNNTQWAWQLHGARVKEMFDQLWPWLSRLKKEQALRAYAKFDSRPTPRTGRERGPCPPDCTCGRHNLKSIEGLTKSQIRRREWMREYQARYRAKKKGAV